METEQSILGAIFFGGLLSAVLFYESLMFVRGKQSASWVPTPAKIEDVIVKTREDDGHEFSKPHIEYSYKYGGVTYRGTRFAFGNIWTASYGQSMQEIAGLRRGGTSLSMYHLVGQACQSSTKAIAEICCGTMC